MPNKVITFVDGENIVFRYQSMRDAGWVPRTPELAHEPDCFLWLPAMSTHLKMNVVRVNYYTSVVGDDKRLAEVAEKISNVRYHWQAGFPGATMDAGHGQLIPRIHKKAKQRHKSRAVDIHITMDLMRAALTMPIDAVCIVSGDGDYLQLVNDVVRGSSKQVIVAAFSDGLAEPLKSCADGFVDLDPMFFSAKPPAKPPT
jgi:uncharacterized LabA/DUF88 family protein